MARTNPSFCLNNSDLTGAAAPAAPLSYQWKVDDTAFDLTAKFCLTNGQAGARKDMVIALDRSESLTNVDSSRQKVATDEASTTSHILQELAAEAATNPQAAPKIGLVLFSTAADCSEYKNGAIIMDREFPCLYVPAKSAADTTHMALLASLLTAAKGLYSQGGLAASGDLTVVSKLLSAGTLGTSPSVPEGLLLFSDGRSFTGTAGDPYAYLRSGAYASAEANAVAAFKALTNVQLVFVLAPTVTPALDGTNADAYDTMCALPTAASVDCDTTKVQTTNPATWPVNQLDVHAFAQNLVNATGGTTAGVIQLTQTADIDGGLALLRATGGVALTIDAASIAINGGAPQAGILGAGGVTFDNLPTGQALTAELTLSSNGQQLTLPITMTTTEVASSTQDLLDQQMLCSGENVAPVTVAPVPQGVSLKDLQGGSGSCGTSGAGSSPRSRALLALTLLFPLLAAAAAARRRTRAKNSSLYALIMFFGGIGVVTTAAPSARAETAGGLNVLQYRPVVDGVANTETATAIAPGTYNAGAFLSYASNPLELGGDKGKRVAPIVDNLITAHFIANIGLFDRVSLGVHVPYVQSSAEDRTVSGTDQKAQELGRPADTEALLKISIIRRTALSFGFAPLVTIPTGDPSLLIGDGSPSYGGLFLLSGIKGPWSWAFDAGYLQRQKALELADDRAKKLAVTGQALSYGGGEYRASARLALGVSVQAKFTTGDTVDFVNSNPAEWDAVAKFRALSSLELEGGFGTGIGKGYGSPSYRVFAGLTYVPQVAPVSGKTTVQKPAPQTPGKSAAAAMTTAPAPAAPGRHP